MYWSGVTQGLMLKQFNHEGMLEYPIFLNTVLQILPMHRMRAIGGTIYLAGVFIMIYNLWKTAGTGLFVANESAQVPARADLRDHGGKEVHPYRHRWIEAKPIVFTIWTVIAIAVGGLLELIPLALVRKNVPAIASVKPYTPLELCGRDLYIREGCVGCHSQMIRPFRSETERYGEYSKAGEFIYDHPFLWGSRRTGPDLHRQGGKYLASWHYKHMEDPTSMSPGSIMPSYPWMLVNKLETTTVSKRIQVLRKLGVPYEPGFEAEAPAHMKAQAEGIAADLKSQLNITVEPDREIVAMIAYLQRLGTDIKVPAAPAPAPKAEAGPAAPAAEAHTATPGSPS
jgi:cytochrome c oxidase cbb3-type subunit I/II